MIVDELPANLNAEMISLHHTDLKRTGDSPYRSECPKCERGVLLIFRDNKNRLMRHDRCVSCAQRVFYLDDTINDEPLIDVTAAPDVTRRTS